MIFATDFVASASGVATLSLRLAVDNRATVFVGGTVSGTNTNKPVITGGTQIGDMIWNVNPPDGTPRAFTFLQQATGTTSVTAGTNTLYVVVDDYISVPGATTFGSIGLLVTPVPEPSTYAMALAGVAIGGWRMMRGRQRRDAAAKAAPRG